VKRALLRLAAWLNGEPCDKWFNIKLCSGYSFGKRCVLPRYHRGDHQLVFTDDEHEETRKGWDAC
jgi:hypothetical protein